MYIYLYHFYKSVSARAKIPRVGRFCARFRTSRGFKLQWNAEIRTSEIQTMLKSKQSIVRTDEQTCSDFRSFGSFDRSDFGIHSIRMPIMPKSKCSNRIVRISDNIINPNRSIGFWDYFLFEPNLVPNREALSEIRTRSDFSIPLYLSLNCSQYSPPL